MKRTNRLRRFPMLGIFALVLFQSLDVVASDGDLQIVCASDATANVKLAAKEVRRYVYLRTGELLPVANSGMGIAVKIDPVLGPQEYRLKSNGGSLTISGGSDVAVLYGAYAFAEKLDVRFYLHGDVIPDQKIPFAIPKLDETCKPAFAMRGILPFHDFPEGPDLWEADDYKRCCRKW